MTTVRVKQYANDLEKQRDSTLVSGDARDGKIVDGTFVIADGAAADEGITHPKEIYCFCCCDYRWAVIVINAIAIVGMLLNLISNINLGTTAVAIASMILVLICHAAGIYGAWKFRPCVVTVAAVVHLSGLISGIVIFFLVAKDDTEMISTTGFAYVSEGNGELSADEVASVVYVVILVGIALAVVLSAFFFHAHVRLIRLLKQGKMTPQN